MNIFPPYPPAGAPLAPVPYPPQAPPLHVYPDGTPASPAPSLPLNAHDMGKVHGLQARGVWEVGDGKPQTLIDSIRAPNLWRVTAFGPEGITVDLTYGTAMTRQLKGLALPLRLNVPGQVTLTARPTDPDHDTKLEVEITLTPATSGGLIEAARLAEVGALDPDAFRYTALTNSALTIRGVPVAVAALQSVRLLSGSVLVSGDGLLEFDT